MCIFLNLEKQWLQGYEFCEMNDDEMVKWRSDLTIASGNAGIREALWRRKPWSNRCHVFQDMSASEKSIAGLVFLLFFLFL